MPQAQPFPFFTRSFIVAALLSLPFIFSNCNDTGTSPYAPEIRYKIRAIGATKNQAVTPDSVLITGLGAISGYSAIPALPSGMILNPITGVISGNPSESSACANYDVVASGPRGQGKDTLTICVSDNAHRYRVNKGPYAPVITYTSLGISAVKNTAIIPDSVVDSLGGAITSYSVSPALPAGMMLNAQSGVISGTPTDTISSKLYVVSATGPSGTGVMHLGICIAQDNAHTCNANVDPPWISYFSNDGTKGPGFMWASPNAPLDSLVPDITYSGIITGYSVSPDLPTGVSLNPATGVISGTPAAAMVATGYQITANGPFGTDSETVYIGVYSGAYPFDLLVKGKLRFREVCAECHGSEAMGGRVPLPLYHSDFLMLDKHRPIRIQMLGLPNFVDTATTIYVRGNPYSNSMPPQGGGDSDIAGVLTFVRAFFNGATDIVAVQEVANVRDSLQQVCPEAHQRNVNNTSPFDCDPSWVVP